MIRTNIDEIHLEPTNISEKNYGHLGHTNISEIHLGHTNISETHL